MLAGQLGEEALLARMRDLFGSPATGVAVGIGDDAAVIDPPAVDQQEVWTADLMLEGIHFRVDWQSAWELGRKSLAVNLSDLASMGATPRFALLSLACPPHTEVDYILDFCAGLKELAEEVGLSVIGGDTTASDDGLIINISAAGVVTTGRALLRNGAGVGDRIYVTGHLGSAAGGLQALSHGAGEKWPRLRRAFIAPEARLAAGRAAVQLGATAMTDISDGLASDLRHICDESQVGAVVLSKQIPLEDELRLAAAEEGWDLDVLALTGGEDYELLFTLPADSGEESAARIAAAGAVPVTAIGEIVAAAEGMQLVAADGAVKPFPTHGFDHFSSDG